MSKVVLLLLVLLNVTQLSAESLNWDKVSLAFRSTSFDTQDRITGVGLYGTGALNEDFYVLGGFERATDHGYVYEAFSAGIGYRYYATSNLAIFSSVSAAEIEIVGGNNNRFYGRGEKVNGGGVQLGVRSLVTSNLELSGAIMYESFDGDSQSLVGISALYKFTKNLSTEVDYIQSDNSDTTALSLVFFF